MMLCHEFMMPAATPQVMMASSGHFVHIDFGHILGHAKYFLGVNRDPTPFVFPSSFAVLMCAILDLARLCHMYVFVR